MKALINWFLGLFKNPYFTGVLPDNRTPDQVSQDYLHEELTPAPVVTDPFGYPQLAASLYPYVSQFGTSSCVPHAVGLGLAIQRKLDTGNYSAIAPIFAYRLRSNFSGEGSIPANIYAIYKQFGAPLADAAPTPQTEAAANALVVTTQMFNEAAIFKGNLYFKLATPNDITAIATIAMQNHAVALCLYATYNEWAQEYPQIYQPTLTQDNAEVQHEVCVLPNSGFILNGVKYVAIQDSAWFGGFKLRYLSETFIKTRVTESRYWTTVSTLATGLPPKFTFTQTLKTGMTSNEVKQMQLLLISEGVLPPDCATGYFGGLTLAGVRAFQEKYAADILLPQGLQNPTGVWSTGSIKKANQLCSG